MELLSKDGVAYNVVPLKLSVWWGGKVCYLWSAYDAVHMQATVQASLLQVEVVTLFPLS